MGGGQMKKLLTAAAIVLFVGAFFQSPQVIEAKKPRPTPKPTPTLLPTPTPTPSPTPSPTPGTANLVLSVSAPSQVLVSEPIQYTIQVTNLGPDPAHDVEFCSLFNPRGFGLIGLDHGTWDYLNIGGGGGRYTECSMCGREALLASGSSLYMSFATEEPEPTTKINYTETSALDLDPDWSNNVATVTTVVVQ